MNSHQLKTPKTQQSNCLKKWYFPMFPRQSYLIHHGVGVLFGDLNISFFQSRCFQKCSWKWEKIIFPKFRGENSKNRNETTWNLKQPFLYWMFHDVSIGWWTKCLYKNLVFHQTSAKHWLFKVPGTYARWFNSWPLDPPDCWRSRITFEWKGQVNSPSQKRALKRRIAR